MGEECFSREIVDDIKPEHAYEKCEFDTQSYLWLDLLFWWGELKQCGDVQYGFYSERLPHMAKARSAWAAWCRPRGVSESPWFWYSFEHVMPWKGRCAVVPSNVLLHRRIGNFCHAPLLLLLRRVYAGQLSTRGSAN